MIVTLLKPVASPWGTRPAGASIELPDGVAAAWVADGVAVATVPTKETTAQAPPAETAAQPPPKLRGRPKEKRG